MSTKKLIQTYRQILETADLAVTDDDCVSLRVPQADGKVKLVPLTIKGKRLVLPTKTHLSNPDWENRICLHTLSENIAAGESEVLEKLRACLNHRLNTVIPIIALALLRIGASIDDQKKLDPEQAEFLSAVKNVDQKTIDDFTAILGKMPSNTPTKQFVSIFLRRKATLDGTEYFRAGIVNFPFYAELVKREGTVHGVKLRKKDFDTLIGLFDYILPHQGESNYYSRGTDSRTAPSTDAVMKAVLAVAGPLNDVVDRFGKLLPEGLEIPCDWAPTFDNLGTLVNEIREIPMLQGNEGQLTTTEVAAPAPAPKVVDSNPHRTSAPQVSEYRAPIPGAQPAARAPVPSSSGQMTDLETLLRNNPAYAAQVGYGARNWNTQPPQPTRASWNNPVAPAPAWGGGIGGGWRRTL